MSKIQNIFSVINYAIRGAVCFQFTHFPSDDWENIYTLSYYHHQIGSMNYHPLFRVRSWNNGVQWCAMYVFLYSYVWIVWEKSGGKIQVPYICSRYLKGWWEQTYNPENVSILLIYYSRGLFLLTWIANYIYWSVLRNYSFPNFSGAVIKVWECISDCIPYFTGNVITHPCWYWSWSMLVRCSICGC